MSFYQQFILIRLTQYSLLYVQVGKIELTLREVIPTTFRSFTNNREKQWLDFLTFDPLYRNSLKAFRESKKVRDDYPPLSFWTSLFSLKNYQALWVPHLSTAFPNLANPHSRKSFLLVNRLMFELRRVRNRIAHFDFPEDLDVERDGEQLRELLRLLGR